MGNFHEEGKPIYLLFDRKGIIRNMANFHEKGKPIVLFFDQK